MRVLVATSSNGGLEDIVSPVFARAPTFTLVTVEGGRIKGVKVVRNEVASSGRGAGVRASQLAAGLKAEVVVAGNFGPLASETLAKAGIKTFRASGIRVREAIEALVGKGIGAARPKESLVPKTEQGIPTHEQCIYFHRGKCTLHNIRVDGKGTDICPFFTPKVAAEVGKEDLDFEIRMLKLEKKMIEETIKHVDRKIKLLEKRLRSTKKA